MEFSSGTSGGIGQILIRRIRAFNRLWLTVGVFCAATAYAEQLSIKTYTVADGLLRDTVGKIKQDSRGFLWFCTAEGVSRFDGYAFTNFTTDDGLPERHVNDFLETGSGAIYLATNSGIAKLNPRGIAHSESNPLFTNYSPARSSASAVNVLYKNKSGAILAGTSDGLYKFDEGNFTFERIDVGEPLPNEKTIVVTAILEDRNGVLWIGTDENGLRRLSPAGKIEIFTDRNNLHSGIAAALFEDAAGNIWEGTQPDELEGGLNLLLPEPDANDSIVKRHYSSKDGLTSNWVTSMYQTADDGFWLGTTSGLCLWQGENAPAVCKSYRAANGLCDADVLTITEDKDENLWTSSRCGVKKLSRYGFTSYGESDGMFAGGINSIFENAAGELFASTIEPKGRVIYRFDGDKFASVVPRLPADIKYFGWGSKQAVFQDREDSWWIPTPNGLFRFPPGTKFENLDKTTPQNVSPPEMSGEIFRLYEDSRRDVWVSTVSKNGVWRWERSINSWHDYTARFGAENQTVTTFVEDQSGNLWLGTGADNGGELVRYRDGRFKFFAATDGLTCGYIRDLYVDRADRLWIANTKNGLLRVDDVNAETLSWQNYARRDGLSSDAALSVTEDVFGRIYAGTPRGVDRLNVETGQIENFTTNDGLPNSFSELAFRDKANNLWFGTNGGLTKYAPEPKRQRQPPMIFVTGLRVNGEPQSISVLGETSISNVDLSSEQRQVSIDFVGLGANLGERLRYEYRLENADWTRTDERTVNFANLSAGDYQFEIRAVTADRIYSAPASVAFRIAAPVYLRGWFIASAFALAALTIFAVYRYRLNKLLEIERTRTRIASDLHDDIGTNLSKISLLSEIVNLQLADQNSESHRLLHSIAEISRESVGSMADIVWAINPQRDSVQELVRRMRLHVESVFLERDVRVAFDAPEDAPIKLSMNVRRELFLIFKEAVNNAVKHSDCRNIAIDLRLENETIRLHIADDGKGFDASQQSDGNGLENMRRRAAKNGGSCLIESAKENGTTLKIVFPRN